MGFNWGNQKHVIILHGLGRSSKSMDNLKSALECKSGCIALNWGYSSIRTGIDKIVDDMEIVLSKYDGNHPSLNFIGFSLGGLVMRRILRMYPKLKVDKMVFIGTPNNGSRFMREKAESCFLTRLMFGKLTEQISNGLWIHNHCDIPSCETLSFAGTKSTSVLNINSLYSNLPGPNDGTVLVDETKMDGVKSIEVDETHTVLMDHPQVIDDTVDFICK